MNTIKAKHIPSVITSLLALLIALMPLKSAQAGDMANIAPQVVTPQSSGGGGRCTSIRECFDGARTPLMVERPGDFYYYYVRFSVNYPYLIIKHYNRRGVISATKVVDISRGIGIAPRGYYGKFILTSSGLLNVYEDCDWDDVCGAESNLYHWIN